MKPAIILIDPQLGENIGMVARAMKNCGLCDLRLVRPRTHWLNEHTIKAAAGAGEDVQKARIFDTTKDAIKDLDWVFATTARQRGMEKRVVTPKQAAQHAKDHPEQAIGILFGKERAGLDNDDIALANRIIEIPLNPEYTSLNLAQAVLICAYEWYQMSQDTISYEQDHGITNALAPKEDLINFFEHLEGALDKTDFFLPKEKRPKMVRNLRNMFQHMPLSAQDVRTLRGVISALTFKGPLSIYKELATCRQKPFDNEG
jgi:tRNA/rRNA methyltransferase